MYYAFLSLFVFNLSRKRYTRVSGSEMPRNHRTVLLLLSIDLRVYSQSVASRRTLGPVDILGLRAPSFPSHSSYFYILLQSFSPFFPHLAKRKLFRCLFYGSQYASFSTFRVTLVR